MAAVIGAMCPGNEFDATGFDALSEAMGLFPPSDGTVGSMVTASKASRFFNADSDDIVDTKLVFSGGAEVVRAL